MLALIDSRDWRLIAHSEWQREADATPLQPQEFEKLQVEPEVIEQLQALLKLPPDMPAPDHEDRDLSYIDPMQELMPDRISGRWLAAFSPVGNTGWIAVVQERRAAAFEAVDELRQRMVLFGVSAVLIVIVLVAGCWWLIVRIVNNRPLLPWNFPGLSSNLPTAGTLSATSRGTERG